MILLEADDAQRGIGEAAPVYWADGESLDMVRQALDDFVVAVGDAPVDTDSLVVALGTSQRDQRGREAEIVAQLCSSGSPAALCAVEGALLDLCGRASARRACDLLSDTAACSCTLARLITSGDPVAVSQEVRGAVSAGARVVKLKVGAVDLQADVARVQAARHSGGSGVQVRLDANRCWSFGEARDFLVAVGRDSIDYVEEPLADADAQSLVRLRSATGIPIALDESLSGHHDLDRFVAASSCDVVVLKTARLGGPSRAVSLARTASSCGLRVVFTDSIETAVGRAVTIHAAAAHSTTPEPLGLGGEVLFHAGGTKPIPEQCSAKVDGPGLGVDIAGVLAGLT